MNVCVAHCNTNNNCKVNGDIHYVDTLFGNFNSLPCQACTGKSKHWAIVWGNEREKCAIVKTQIQEERIKWGYFPTLQTLEK